MLTALPAPRSRPPSASSFAHWSLRPTPATVPLVRAQVSAVLKGWRISPEVAETLLLAVSELATNVVRHAAPVTDRLRVTLASVGGWLRLDVSDGDPTLPCAGRAELGAESGRGLAIVNLLVAEARGEMSSVASEGGKTVRVRLPA
ncbi:ATP-binding protein [Streptomyces flavidovirens]|uniref:ATP-binding protein n=1 Tax=Streptomyces flavidovirens TaxID=67298 RepID=UPI00342362B4